MNEARLRELKEKMAALKSLYASRHYSQCAKFGELLLSEIHDQTHPLHLAHLNFYTALSHDTLAREATLKNRWRELSLAELHYNTAVLALASIQSPTQCDPWTPNSSTSGMPSPYSRRRSSIYSHRSAASSVTSLGDEDDYLHMSPKVLQDHDVAAPTAKVQAAATTTTTTTTTATTTTTTATSSCSSSSPTPRPQTPQQFYFAANIAVLMRMIEAHVADVRDQKRRTGVPTVRFTLPSPRPSPTKTRGARHSRSLSVVDGAVRDGGGDGGDGDGDDEEAAMEAIREKRRNIKFRPRFDPSSIQRLCSEALAELGG